MIELAEARTRMYTLRAQAGRRPEVQSKNLGLAALRRSLQKQVLRFAQDDKKPVSNLGDRTVG